MNLHLIVSKKIAFYVSVSLFETIFTVIGKASQMDIYLKANKIVSVLFNVWYRNDLFRDKNKQSAELHHSLI